MLSKYLKIAWRNLFKRKGFSLANILGLTIGVTSTILIMLWVQDERSWDKFHSNYDNIYQVYANRNFNGEIVTDNSIMLPLGDELKRQFPDVTHASFVSYNETHVLNIGDTRLKMNGYRASKDYFAIFSWKFLSGNGSAALNDPDGIVITKSTAQAFFGDSDPINKIIRIDNNRDHRVTGVVEDPANASTFRFAFILPFDYTPEAMQDWQNSYTSLYLLKTKTASPTSIEQKINLISKQHDPGTTSTYFMHPMSKWRLYADFRDGKNTGGLISYVKMFTIIAIIILLIACINFMNLSTASSEKRAKEIGVRKTLGSGRKQLMFQFFCESIILATVSLIFSLLVIYLVLPAFNLLVDKQLVLPVNQPVFWLLSVALVLFTGIVAGSYPAIYLSSFNPVKVLKGTFKAGKAALVPRRVLVVGQFIICIILISATIIVYKQLNFVKHRDIGYKQDNLLMIPTSQSINDKYAVIKQELLQTGLITAVTRTSSPITDIWNYTPAPDYEGKPAKGNMILTAMRGQVDFIKTTGIRLLQGRDFEGTPADSSSMLLNEAAVKTMGLKNPLGMKMRYNNRDYIVIGVVGNVVMSSPYNPVDPMMILYGTRGGAFVNVRLAESTTPQKALAAMTAIFSRHAPDVPFEYRFADQEFGRKFVTEELIGKLTNIFAGLAIFICCLGLSGLVAFTTQKRIREIGVRKVLGASVQQLLLMLSKEFLWLVIIAAVIAVPIAWWGLNDWIQQYNYRVDINIWQFVLAGAAVLFLTLITVCANAVKATVTKPVKSLRSE